VRGAESLRGTNTQAADFVHACGWLDPSLADAAVDAFAHQVGVPAVPGVLLDPVYQQFPEGDSTYLTGTDCLASKTSASSHGGAARSGARTRRRPALARYSDRAALVAFGSKWAQRLAQYVGAGTRSDTAPVRQSRNGEALMLVHLVQNGLHGQARRGWQQILWQRERAQRGRQNRPRQVSFAMSTRSIRQ
jgi:hypothetical protein